MHLFSFVVAPHLQPLPRLSPLFLVYAVFGHLPLWCIPTAQLVSPQHTPNSPAFSLSGSPGTKPASALACLPLGTADQMSGLGGLALLHSSAGSDL